MSATMEDYSNLEESLYGKSYKCPVCDAQFKSQTVKQGRQKLISQDTDFKNNYKTIDPLYYDIVICPVCGYATLSRTFSKITAKKIEIMLSRQKVITPTKYDPVLSTRDAIERFNAALHMAEFLERNPSEKGILCTNLAWLYRDAKDKKSELQHMKMAVTFFVSAIQNEKPPYSGYDEGRVKLIVGDFLRRLGKKEDAKKWIGSVLVDSTSLPQHKEKALEIKDLLIQ